MAIHQWPMQDRPREKLFAQGANNLTDAELLAILIGSGTKGQSAVEVARKVLAKTGSLRALLTQNQDDIKALTGIGQATLARMQAALELSRRYLYETIEHTNVLDSPTATRLFLRARLQDIEHEVFAMLMLDNQHRIIAFEILFQGTLDHSAIYPREIIKMLLRKNAAAVIIVHNHPSGYVTPSEADVAITHQLQQALSAISVRLLDHLIVGNTEVLSLVEEGLFP